MMGILLRITTDMLAVAHNSTAMLGWCAAGNFRKLIHFFLQIVSRYRSNRVGDIAAVLLVVVRV
jgi:hypothetical protein